MKKVVLSAICLFSLALNSKAKEITIDIPLPTFIWTTFKTWGLCISLLLKRVGLFRVYFQFFASRHFGTF